VINYQHHGIYFLLCRGPLFYLTNIIQINQPTRCNSSTSLLLDIYVWLNKFRAPFRPSSGAYNCTRSLWFYRWSVTVGALLVVVWHGKAPGTVRRSNPGGGEIFRTCQDQPWGPPSLLYNGYRAFPGGKERPGRDADPSLPFSAVGHERVELYLYFPNRPYGLYRASVPVQWCTLPYLYLVTKLTVRFHTDFTSEFLSKYDYFHIHIDFVIL